MRFFVLNKQIAQATYSEQQAAQEEVVSFSFNQLSDDPETYQRHIYTNYKNILPLSH